MGAPGASHPPGPLLLFWAPYCSTMAARVAVVLLGALLAAAPAHARTLAEVIPGLWAS